MLSAGIVSVLLSNVALAAVAANHIEPECGATAPNVAEPRFMIPFELVQGAIPLSTLAGYVGGLRVHPTINPRPDGWIRFGGSAALLRSDGGSELLGGGRLSARPYGSLFLSIWTSAEYLAGDDGKRAYGAALTGELAKALQLTLRFHRNEPSNDWSFDIGAGFDLRYFIAKGYAARPPKNVPAVALTPNWFVLIENEVAVSTSFLTDQTPENKVLRARVRDRFNQLTGQPDMNSILDVLSRAGVDTVVNSLKEALVDARANARANNPEIPVPDASAEVALEEARSLLRGLASNLCVRKGD